MAQIPTVRRKYMGGQVQKVNNLEMAAKIAEPLLQEAKNIFLAQQKVKSDTLQAQAENDLAQMFREYKLQNQANPDDKKAWLEFDAKARQTLYQYGQKLDPTMRGQWAQRTNNLMNGLKGSKQEWAFIQRSENAKQDVSQNIAIQMQRSRGFGAQGQKEAALANYVTAYQQILDYAGPLMGEKEAEKLLEGFESQYIENYFYGLAQTDIDEAKKQFQDDIFFQKLSGKEYAELQRYMDSVEKRRDALLKKEQDRLKKEEKEQAEKEANALAAVQLGNFLTLDRQKEVLLDEAEGDLAGYMDFSLKAQQLYKENKLNQKDFESLMKGGDFFGRMIEAAENYEPEKSWFKGMNAFNKGVDVLKDLPMSAQEKAYAYQRLYLSLNDRGIALDSYEETEKKKAKQIAQAIRQDILEKKESGLLEREAAGVLIGKEKFLYDSEKMKTHTLNRDAFQLKKTPAGEVYKVFKDKDGNYTMNSVVFKIPGGMR